MTTPAELAPRTVDWAPPPAAHPRLALDGTVLPTPLPAQCAMLAGSWFTVRVPHTDASDPTQNATLVVRTETWPVGGEVVPLGRGLALGEGGVVLKREGASAQSVGGRLEVTAEADGWLHLHAEAVVMTAGALDLDAECPPPRVSHWALDGGSACTADELPACTVVGDRLTAAVMSSCREGGVGSWSVAMALPATADGRLGLVPVPSRPGEASLRLGFADLQAVASGGTAVATMDPRGLVSIAFDDAVAQAGEATPRTASGVLHCRWLR